MQRRDTAQHKYIVVRIIAQNEYLYRESGPGYEKCRKGQGKLTTRNPHVCAIQQRAIQKRCYLFSIKFDLSQSNTSSAEIDIFLSRLLRSHPELCCSHPKGLLTHWEPTESMSSRLQIWLYFISDKRWTAGSSAFSRKCGDQYTKYHCSAGHRTPKKVSRTQQDQCNRPTTAKFFHENSEADCPELSRT